MANLSFLKSLPLVFATIPLWARPISPTYTVGIEGVNLSPIVMIEPQGKRCLGYACEVLEQFARRKKIQFQYVPMPVNRAHLEFWNGKVDFMFPDHPEWSAHEKERLKLKIAYSDPVLTFQDAVLVSPAHLGQGIEKIKVMSTIRGFTIWKLQPLVEAEKLKILGAPTPEASIQMFFVGRVDAVTMPLQIANYHLKKMNRVGALVPDPALIPIQSSSYYLSSIRHPRLIKDFNLFLKKEEPLIHRLKQRKGL